ncbi:hypothetical protein [Pedobacter aquatilis]|uniref:hypothetical protein n=1 Tax=Pedobacter aquatilis TaxID=351343 RepID=UPI00293120B1|nr:hypothetical protein [Pedobacter aquatilis]
MNEIINYLKTNITISITISILVLLIAILSYRINWRKFKIDKADSENKKSKFSIYLENSYRFNYKIEDEKFILFDIRINNYSTLKTSFIAQLKIVYLMNENKKTEILIEHDPSLFHLEYHNNLVKFSKQIRIDDREIKSGWLIFNFPKSLLGKRVDYYEIILQDVLGNKSSVICNLLRDIDYGD